MNPETVRAIFIIGCLLMGAMFLHLSKKSWKESKVASIAFLIIAIVFSAFYIAISFKM